MAWCSLRAAKVSACRREAIKMLSAITMLFWLSPRRDVRTDPWVVSPLLHSDIFVYLFCVFQFLERSLPKQNVFSTVWFNKVFASFPSLSHLLPDLPPLPSLPLFLARSLQRCNGRLDSASPPALKAWTRRGSDDRRRANVQVTMTRADEDGGRRRLFQESHLQRLNDILNFLSWTWSVWHLLSCYRTCCPGTSWVTSLYPTIRVMRR